MEKYEDKTLSKEKRIAEYNKEIDKLMNPIPEEDFNRETFDPIKIEGMEDLVIRKRAIKKGKLPTYSLLISTEQRCTVMACLKIFTAAKLRKQ